MRQPFSNNESERVSYWHATADRDIQGDELPAQAEVLVVGGGLLGVCTAYWLAHTGTSVALLERAGLAAGATGRNGGFMVAGTAESYPAAIARLGHATARAVWELTLESRALLRQALAEEAIACDYREPGSLHLALGGEQMAELEKAAAALRADGFAGELLGRAQAQQLIDTPLGPTIAGALFSPENGLLHSARLIDGLGAAARRRGAALCRGVEVTGIEPSAEGVLVHTADRSIRARAVVVATNAWLDQLVPALAGKVNPVRGQALAYQPAARVFRTGMGAERTPTGEYWQQAPDGTIVLGGCRAVAPGWDVGVREQAPTPEVQTALERVLSELFPELAVLKVARRWAGLMAFTADYLPIVDRVPGVPRAWFVGGFSGHGMPFGMRLGQLLAASARGDDTSTAMAPFRLDRPTLI